MKLYGYWRSSAAYRVRIALHLKNLEFQLVSVHLVNNGGEQHSAAYAELNPNQLVPTLVDGDIKLHQSMAIINYLDARYPDLPLYPENIVDKAMVQAMAFDVACEIHPLNNLRVQQYLSNTLTVSEQQKTQWTHHWMALGFNALELQLAQYSGTYCFGDEITVADICLIPQVYNALRFKLDMSPYPNILRVVAKCNEHPAFIAALPERQADAQ
jgi:maleylpyruvate isomerase